MGQWKLWFFLLLLLWLCFDIGTIAQELLSLRETNPKTIVKTISGGESDVTPLCPTAPLHTIMLIVCKINTKRSRGEECHLLYQYGEEIENDCDSKFRLIKENQTIFLHLTGLTSLDSGNHSCECSHARGTGALHLNITVEGDEEEEASTFFNSLTVVVGGVAVFIIVSGVFLGLILRKNHCRHHTRPEPHEFPEFESPLEDDDLNDPYTSLQLPTSDVYEAISSVRDQRYTHTVSTRDNIPMTQLYRK